MDLEEMVIYGARMDPRPDKSDWIRIWVAIREAKGYNVDAETWKLRYTGFIMSLHYVDPPVL